MLTRGYFGGEKFSITGLVLLLPFLFVVNLFAQQQPKTNLQLMQEIITPKLFSPIKQSIPSGKSIVIRAASDDECSQLFAKILTDSCVQANYLVYSSADSAEIPVYRVILTDAECSVVYYPQKRKWLVGKLTYLREIGVSTHLQIANPASQILVSRQVSERFTDKIASDAIADVENPNFSITKGTKTSKGGFNRWVEPILLSAATIAVIFSFYSLRSNN
jgi:hypothetical protein